jgi:hypothetical protein
MPPTELPELLDAHFAERDTKVTGYLAAAWSFADIETDVWNRPGHRFKSRRHGSISELIVKAAYDFDDALRMVHPGIVCKSVADFFTSWQFWRHMAKFAADAGDSDVAKLLAGDGSAARAQAKDTLERLYEQLCSYSHHLLSGIPPPTAIPIVVGDSLTLTDATAPASTQEISAEKCTRSAEVDAFLTRCNDVSTIRIIRRHIWLAVGHTKPRQFEYWQGCKPKATDTDNENFARVLAMDPGGFIALLTRKGIIQ